MEDQDNLQIPHSNLEQLNCASKKVDNETQRIYDLKLDFDIVAIGVMESIFNKKNGTPRQSGICPQSKGIIRLHKKLYNNPFHALQGIDQFQYIWVLYYFHENKNKRRFIAKVHPPRLNGTSCGVFASRAPHRPNPVGLTLARLDAIQDGALHVSGIDIIDQTPIIDIKPYIEKYDYPILSSVSSASDNLISSTAAKECDDVGTCLSKVKEELNNKYQVTSMPDGWIDGAVVSEVEVDFTSRSMDQLSQFHAESHHTDSTRCMYCFRLFCHQTEAKAAITNLLQADPRSVYRRNKCVDRLYFFTIDSIHITAWFDIETNLVEVVKIKPYITQS